jgi:hypothetical protein
MEFLAGLTDEALPEGLVGPLMPRDEAVTLPTGVPPSETEDLIALLALYERDSSD